MGEKFKDDLSVPRELSPFLMQSIDQRGLLFDNVRQGNAQWDSIAYIRSKAHELRARNSTSRSCPPQSSWRLISH